MPDTTVPVSYPILVQHTMIHHDMSPSLEVYVHTPKPTTRPRDLPHDRTRRKVKSLDFTDSTDEIKHLLQLGKLHLPTVSVMSTWRSKTHLMISAST
jgi:hypothetical protein